MKQWRKKNVHPPPAGKAYRWAYTCKKGESVIRKCKQCDWLTTNYTYSLCHACGGELQEWKLPKLKIRPTKRASDGLKSPAKNRKSAAGSKSPAKKRKVTSRA